MHGSGTIVITTTGAEPVKVSRTFLVLTVSQTQFWGLSITVAPLASLPGRGACRILFSLAIDTTPARQVSVTDVAKTLTKVYEYVPRMILLLVLF